METRGFSQPTLAFFLVHVGHDWFRDKSRHQMSWMSSSIQSPFLLTFSNQTKLNKTKASDTFRIQCLGCYVFQNVVEMMYLLKA